MAWIISFSAEFDEEFREMPDRVQDELLTQLNLLAEIGPRLGRPHVDTLKGSNYSNMKELRFDTEGGV